MTSERAQGTDVVLEGAMVTLGLLERVGHGNVDGGAALLD